MPRVNRTSPRIRSLSRPVDRGSVVRLVLERIRDAMVAGELGCGDYLPSETELTRNLGVGKTSIREAVKMLEAMGVVEVRQGHGTRIREHASEDSVGPLIFQLILQQATNADLLELRTLFEPTYTVAAAEKATPEDIVGLEECVEGFAAKIHAGTQTAEDDLEFHRLMLECTRNPFVIQIGITMHQLFRRSIERSMVTVAGAALRDHRAILEAVKSRDPRRIRQAVLMSFESWQQSLREVD